MSRELNGGAAALNAVCAYFTMFPLDFPTGLLADARPGEAVLDPFCGRGTTLFAARLLGLSSVGIDSSPVAAAISRAKLARAGAPAVLALVARILREVEPDPVPDGPFWALAYHPETLDGILRLRAGLRDRTGPAADILRAIVLGALHGPLAKTRVAFLSNQMPRTFAAKPSYLARYWAERGMAPPRVDVLAHLRVRADRYLAAPIPPGAPSRVILGDARDAALPRGRFSHVVTSPPYFGMRTYVPDQWLRGWFLGGPPTPAYVQRGQLGRDGNAGPSLFAAELGRVWANVAPACRPGARLTVRIGAIPSRPSDPIAVLRASLEASGAPWRILDVRETAGPGWRRQANQMGERGKGSGAAAEYDVACRLAS